MSHDPHILIVGSGSVGKRHARNLASLGCSIACVDPRADRNDELAGEVTVTGAFTALDVALRDATYDAAVIGSPPHVHVDQASACLAARLPVFLEKPVSPDLAGAATLRALQAQGDVPVLLGYTWRWWPPLQRVRKLLSEHAIGTVRHVRFVMSAHLADWHPWERYQDFFMASKALGGGALLDESHWTDIACWLFGAPESVAARVEHISDLEIDSDDNVDMLLTYGDGLRVSLHLDLYGRPHEKSITFVGERGTLRWTADPNELRVSASAAGWDSVETFDVERNDMFLAAAREFLDVLGGAAPSCTLDDGVTVLRVIEAARRSSDAGRTIGLQEVDA